MLANLFFFGILASGSVFCSVKFDKKFEEILPITCMGIGVILFLFGIVGALKAGVYFIIAASMLFYILTGYVLMKHHDYLVLLKKNCFTVGSLFFCFLTIILSVSLKGLLASKWDEFSHWIDIVKVMTTLDDFGTNPQSFSAFQSYPPAMTLFQYMLQKVNLILNPRQGFSEWRVYFAYQIYFIAVLLPFFKNIQWKELVKIISLILIILVTPVVFYADIYCSAYIDPFLAILAGAGFSAVILQKSTEKDIYYSIYVFLVISTLVLSKDAGIIFALFLSILYVTDYCISHQIIEKHLWNASTIGNIAVPFLAVFIPKILWKWELTSSKARISFETHINLGTLVNVFLGKDDSYRTEVLKNYIQAFFDEYITIGYTRNHINYFALFTIMTIALIVIFKLFYEKNRIQGSYAFLCTINIILQLITFIVGMCILYMFNFSEYEALRLASFSRYLNIIFLATALIILLSLWTIIFEISCLKSRKYGMILCLCILICAPLKAGIIDSLNGANRDASVQNKEPYNELIDKIMEVCDGDDVIYLIAQQDSGYHRWIIRFSVRPNRIEGSYSIGEPFYDGDIWTEEKTAEEWQQELIENYDYVALYSLNDYFYENFSEVFADPDSIYEDGVYRVDKESGLLYLEN